MKNVAYINLRDAKGGAMIAMNRLIESLARQYNVNNKILVGVKDTGAPNVIQMRTRVQRAIENRIIDPFFNRIGFQYHWFPFSSYNMMRLLREAGPEIINLHLAHSSFFQTSMLPKISRIAPIVWTLHDMWAFTGNSAHTFGDESWKTMQNPDHLAKIYPAIGINRGAQLLQKKKRLYAKSDLTMVTPSRWLRDLAVQSPVFEGKTILHINNGVDLNIFKPQSKTEVRKKLDIPQNAKVLVFSSAYLTGDIWKGGDLLIEVLRRINALASQEIYLLLIGSGGDSILSSFPKFMVRQTGYVDDEKLMALYLSASDLFLYPTRADNLPNSLVEAIACGVPSVTFDIGGCGEIVINDYNGIIVKPFDFDTIAAQVIKCLDSDLGRMSQNARKHAEENYGADKMGREYYSLFEQILARNDKRTGKKDLP
jgi:glycosyltransferase involved in cell wall biosynthesis